MRGLLHYKINIFYKTYNVWTYRVLAIENITLMNAYNFLNVVLDLVLNSSENFIGIGRYASTSYV